MCLKMDEIHFFPFSLEKIVPQGQIRNAVFLIGFILRERKLFPFLQAKCLDIRSVDLFGKIKKKIT